VGAHFLQLPERLHLLGKFFTQPYHLLSGVFLIELSAFL
jgi:hypothetical protein